MPETDPRRNRNWRRSGPACAPGPRRCGARCTCGTWTPARTAPRSRRSLRCSIRSTTSTGSGSSSPPARGTRMCCWSPEPARTGWPSRCGAPTTGMPDPKIVIAVGTDAVSGGLVGGHRGSYATAAGVGDVVPVDVWVPGSPPSPFNILHALLAALGRLPHRADGAVNGPGSGSRGRAGGAAAAGVATWSPASRRARLRSVPYLAGAAGAACLAVAGAGAVAGHPARLGAGGWLGAGTAWLAADRLSGLFLVLAFGAALPVSLAFASWAARPGAVGRRGLGASYALTLGAVARGHDGDGRVHLLLAWELLTVAFYLLAGFERGRRGRAGAAADHAGIRQDQRRRAAGRACCCWRSGPARWSWPRSRRCRAASHGTPRRRC